jgi:hypothetical protein
MAVLYSIWLGLFLFSSRKSIKLLWPIYIFFHVIVFPIQYMSAVGAPPFLCFGKEFRIEKNCNQDYL